MKRNQYWKELFILVYAFGALSTTQTIPLIKHFGFNETQQGFLLASIALFTIFLQIGFGILSDKTGKMKPYFLVLFLCCTGLTGILYMNTFQEFWLVFLLVGGIGGACRCYQTMMDTWVMQCD
ncbi:MAG: MFS transporter [Erysipelotrichaceae bacterium]|nr:MFS transporter [Erysipelotrichaceae bacterium]